MDARPTKNETDEDLLAQQEEFLKKLTQKIINPSSRLVKPDRPYVKPEPERDVKQMETVPNTKIVPEFVLGGIVEKNVDVGKPVLKNAGQVGVTGFPQAPKRSLFSSKKRGSSIFAQQLAQKQSNEPATTESVETSMDMDMNVEQSTPNSSNLVNGPESKEIHQENLSKLNAMSPADILKQRQELLMSMDPKLIQFIASKRQKRTDKVEAKSVQFDTKPVEEKNLKQPEEIPAVKEVMSNSNSEKWLHFDKLEIEKYEWMKNVEVVKKLKDKSYEARFNFEGWLQPFSIDELPMDENSRVLYHHGDESARPGYSLKELLHLCRSSVTQQRILALNTIANILALYSTGVYDGVLEIPIEQIFFVIRVAIDENTQPVLLAGMRALKNIFYYEIDEMCLDTISYFNSDLTQPILDYQLPDTEISDKTGMATDQELNDQQLAESNLLSCLLRTDILIRIRYIFNTLLSSTDILFNCVCLLIRMVRDNNEIAGTTIEFIGEHLMTVLMENVLRVDHQLFVSGTILDIKTIIVSLKLLRLCAIRSEKFTRTISNRFNILKPILFYLANDANSTEFVRMQTESFITAATFIRLGAFQPDQIGELQFMISKHLAYHIKNTNIDEKVSYAKSAHASGVIGLVTTCFNTNVALVTETMKQMLDAASIKWFSQLTNITSFKCGHLQIVGALSVCWSTISWPPSKPEIISIFLDSPSFELLTAQIRSSSNLLCSYKPHESRSALDSIQASVWESTDHIIPVLSSRSAIPFLNSFSRLILSSGQKSQLKMVRNAGIKAYLLGIYKTSPKLLHNWFTHRIETKFILNYLQCCIKIQTFLDEQEKYAIYLLTLKIIHIFTEDDRYEIGLILENIIFNLQFIPTANLLQCQLELESTIFTQSFQQIVQIKDYYLASLGLKVRPGVVFLAIGNKNLGFLPTDWFYLPIVVGFTNQKIDIESVRRCLQCVCIFESLIPEISSIIKITDRYCRLACTFLCDNAMFLVPDIHVLLETCFRNILESKQIQELKFDKSIKGLNNFEEFYVSLLEQYQAISYGDILFGNIILLPLTQRQNVKWKKIIWSEYAGVVQIFNLNTDQVMIPINEFLEPAETDMSILKCYNRALKTGQLRRSEFLTKICSYHLDQFNNKR